MKENKQQERIKEALDTLGCGAWWDYIPDDASDADIAPLCEAIREVSEFIARWAEAVAGDDIVEQCPECGSEVWLKWDVDRDGYVVHCPYCGYRMKLCSMCDVRDGGKCDWTESSGKCKHDPVGRYKKFDCNISDLEKMGAVNARVFCREMRMSDEE